MYELLVDAESYEEASEIGENTPKSEWTKYVPEDLEEPIGDWEIIDVLKADTDDIERLSKN